MPTPTKLPALPNQMHCSNCKETVHPERFGSKIVCPDCRTGEWLKPIQPKKATTPKDDGVIDWQQSQIWEMD